MSRDSPSKMFVPNSRDHLHATLRDEAELAGVSTKTVSRVVNHQKGTTTALIHNPAAGIDCPRQFIDSKFIEQILVKLSGFTLQLDEV